MKKPGDLIDMKFKKKEKNKWVMHWACGTIQRIDDDNKNRWYCTFMDGEEGWYDLTDDKDGKIEVRKCEEGNGHTRSENLSLLMIGEKEYKREKMKRRRIELKKGKDQKVRMEETQAHTSLKEKEDESTGLKESRVL